LYGTVKFLVAVALPLGYQRASFLLEQAISGLLVKIGRRLVLISPALVSVRVVKQFSKFPIARTALNHAEEKQEGQTPE
jgi:hypothetical protein